MSEKVTASKFLLYEILTGEITPVIDVCLIDVIVHHVIVIVLFGINPFNPIN